MRLRLDDDLMLREPRQQLLRSLGRPHDPRGRLGLDIGLELQGIGRPRAAPMPRRITRQLHAIDREHLPPDQSVAVTHRQHRCIDWGNIVAPRADEMGYRYPARWSRRS